MPDWTKSMEQSFEYYTVEPTTLADVKRLDNVKNATFSRDAEVATLGSATIDVTNSVGESYIRGYLKTIQNGVTEKFPLGTVLSQTPSSSFNGKVLDVSMDCYTPLIELKEKQPPLGYTVRKGTRIMDAAYNIVRENCRVPVNKVEPIIRKSRNLFDIETVLPSVSHPSYPNDHWEKQDDGSFYMFNPGIMHTVKIFENTQQLSGSFACSITARAKSDESEKNGFGLKFVYTDGSEDRLDTYITTQYAVYTIITNPDKTLDYVYQTYANAHGTYVKDIMIAHGDDTTYVPYGDTDMSPTLQYDFTANTDDTYLSFVSALIANAKYELGLGEKGNIMFLPKQEIESLQPVWTFSDDNTSILVPEITVNHDLYGIPNVVEVIYSYGSDCKQAIAKNEDPNSPTSIQNRGRKIPFRVTDPALRGYVTQEQLDAYAERVLKEASTLEYTVSFTHAYCPVRVGDCVRLNYTRAGITDIKAKIISQNIKAEPGCQVSTKAVFKSKLWR